MKVRRKAWYAGLALAVALAVWSGPVHAKQGADEGVVAKVGDFKVTLAELDDKASSTNMQAYQELYNARKAALDAMIHEELMRREAAAQGISAEQLREKGVTAKVTAVTDADVEAYYKANTARMRGQSLEQIGPQIKTFLESQRTAEAEQAFFDGLRAKYGVTLMLEPPRAEVTIAANDPRVGADDAAIRIVEYSDFE